MTNLDVSATKEIKGVTLRWIVSFTVILATVIITYAKIDNSLQNNADALKDVKELTKEQRLQMEVQYKVIQNQLREQDLRLIKLEAESALNKK